jgi:hypothetical protein
MFRNKYAFLFAITLAMPASAMSPQDIYVRASESVVVVRALDDEGKPKQFGSGVVLTPGEIVTNCHVLKDAKAIKVGRKGEFVEAVLLYSNSKRDLCLLIAPEIKVAPIQLGKAANLKVGAPVFAIGAPKGLELSLSNGLVSQLHLDAGIPVIQTTAAISLGSSGGGLFDEEARLVGITSFYRKDAQNLNFAVPVEWIADLRSGKYFAWKTVVGVLEESVPPAPEAPAPEDAAAPVAETDAPAPTLESNSVDPSWTAIFETNDAHIYLRKRTMQKESPQRVMAWFLFDYNDLQYNEGKKAFFWSKLYRYLFDCGKHKLALLSYLEKGDSAGKGKVIDSFDIEEYAARYSHAAPDTLGEAMLDNACEETLP